PRCSIIAYSLGGIIARKCIADGAAAKVDRLLTVATPHMGTMRFEPLSLSWPERMVPRAGLELRPDSRLLWDLNTNAESSTVPEFASIGGYAWGKTDGLIEMSSASLVKCNPDGSIARKYCFAGVKRSHRNINRVSNKDDEVFRLVRGFLRGGIAGMNAPGEPGKRRAWSNLTFSLKRKPGNRFIYPHIYVENTRRHYWGYKVCSQGARLRDGSYIFSVQIHPDDEDDVRIYYARGKYATVRVRSGQSTIVTQPMGADIPGFRFRSLVPVWIRLSNNEEGT
ncbi:MAG: hypothetical protein IBX68_11975, partial [Dehalococcoidia bacterium]|nr:hypothetical protein [Dehalococcoidia bacterium]